MNIVGSVFSYFRRLFVVGDSVARVQPGRSDSGETVDEISVLGLSAAWACVNVIAGTIGSLPIEMYRLDSQGVKRPYPDHPLARMLKRAPNAEQTALDFWEGGAASLELKGNLVARKLRGVRGDVIGLEPWAWDFTRCWRAENGAIRYENDGTTYDAEDVLHIRGFGGSPLGGLSTIAFGANTFGMARAADRAAGRMFKDGIRSSGVLTVEQQLDAEKRAVLEQLLVEKYQGAMNAGRPMLLDNGAKWESLSINPSDAQLLESRSFSVEEVCRLFGVPPVVVGHTSKTTSWPTGVEQQVLILQRFTFRRRVKRIEQALEQQLLTPADIAAGVSIEFNMDAFLRADTTARFASYQTGLQNGIYTINEVRRMEGLPPVEGGETPRMQMQNVPITEAGSITGPSNQGE